MERVLEIIRKDVATDKVRIDNPTQNLESYFLDVVEQAKRAAAETTGAQSGARVAAYLRGDAEVRKTRRGQNSGAAHLAASRADYTDARTGRGSKNE